jgi:hypothetical protein
LPRWKKSVVAWRIGLSDMSGIDQPLDPAMERAVRLILPMGVIIETFRQIRRCNFNA